MSAELLRHAAKVLRGAVADLPVRVQSDWEQDTSEIYAEPSHEWVGETMQDGGAEIAYYVIRMHPPVALALADLLDTAAFVAEGNGLVDDDRYKDEDALARAILRDPS